MRIAAAAFLLAVLLLGGCESTDRPTNPRATGDAGRAGFDTAERAIMVDEAPTFKRFQARAKGRGNRIIKRNSHITIQVADE